MSDSIKLIVGLGNPGQAYEKTRHNVGACIVKVLADHYDVNLRTESRFFGQFGVIKLPSFECMLLLPNTFMNLSGQSVQACASYYKINANSILVSHDDLDFSPGVARSKHGGGCGGQRGLKDIIEKIGSKDFYRLRFGIGHPGHKDLVSDYVLSRPSVCEKERIAESVEKTLGIIIELISCGNFTGSELMKKL